MAQQTGNPIPNLHPDGVMRNPPPHTQRTARRDSRVPRSRPGPETASEHMAKLKPDQPGSHSHTAQASQPGPAQIDLTTSPSPDPQPASQRPQTHQSPPSQSIPPHPKQTDPHRTGPPREEMNPLARPAPGGEAGQGDQPTARAVRPKIVPLRTAHRSTVGRSCQTPRALIG